MSAQTLPLQLNCFNHLLDLSAIDFPPARPVPDVQWQDTKTAWGGVRHDAKTRVQGWRVYVPGHGAVFLQSEGKALSLHEYLTSHLKAASYLFELGGDLFDTRKGELNNPLRTGYMGIHADITSGQQLKATLRAIPNEPYQSSMFFRTAIGYCLCPDCVRAELPSVVASMRNNHRDMWHVEGFDTLWDEDPSAPVTCDACDRLIQPVYGAQ